MKSHAIPRFWRLFPALPPEVQRPAVKTFRLWQRNPNHPSVRYRRLEDRENLVTVRIGVITGRSVSRNPASCYELGSAPTPKMSFVPGQSLPLLKDR